jgi:hypothetical protein
MKQCDHETCHYCDRIVLPNVQESRVFITKTCPYCGRVISDVAKDPEDRWPQRRGTDERFFK